jgi:XRE family transcriptional regulator, regulator of sulfur utilization
VPICCRLAIVLSVDDVRAHLGANLRRLREARGASQAQMARLSGIPRATWAHLESGSGNPTLELLGRVAEMLQLSLDELTRAPPSETRVHRRDSLPVRQAGAARVRHLLPDPIRGMVLDRMELPPGAQVTGVPHLEGTREYLACEVGELVLHAGGERFQLAAGDVVSFRGDQRHSYRNPGARTAVGYSVVILARGL